MNGLLAAHGYAPHHWDGQRLRPEVRPHTLIAICIAEGDPARHDTWPPRRESGQH